MYKNNALASYVPVADVDWSAYQTSNYDVYMQNGFFSNHL